MKPYEEMTDHELSEAFAVEFLLRKPDEHKYPEDLEGTFAWPNFATSVDALLPYLSNVRWEAQQTGDNEVWVEVDAPEYGHSIETTLPRAICAAMLDAKKTRITT